MPALANPKWENLCQNTIQGLKHGWTQAEIYMRSGYKARGHSAEHAAHRLLKRDEIKSRIAELMQPAAKKAGVTVASLLDELEQARAGATNAEQFSAAAAATLGKAKLAGLLIDRVEQGAPGEFSTCADLRDVARHMLDQGDLDVHLSLLDELRTLLIEAAGNRAKTVVDASEPVRAIPPGAETQAALLALRPDRRNGRHR